jgi:hypothetical protein
MSGQQTAWACVEPLKTTLQCRRPDENSNTQLKQAEVRARVYTGHGGIHWLWLGATNRGLQQVHSSMRGSGLAWHKVARQNRRLLSPERAGIVDKLQDLRARLQLMEAAGSRCSRQHLLLAVIWRYRGSGEFFPWSIELRFRGLLFWRGISLVLIFSADFWGADGAIVVVSDHPDDLSH